jgi:hypothetical protein
MQEAQRVNGREREEHTQQAKTKRAVNENDNELVYADWSLQFDPHECSSTNSTDENDANGASILLGSS